MTDLEKYDQLFEEDPRWGSSPLDLMVDNNDVVALHSYIKKYPERVFLPTEEFVHSPFGIIFKATRDETLDVLRVLLDLADTSGLQIRPVRPIDDSLLDLACRGSQLNTVRFLLDRSPPLGARYASDSHGGLALLSGTASFRFNLPSTPDLGLDGRKIWLRDEITRSEEIVYMLLDKGASVQDAVRSYDFSDVEQDEKPMHFWETALGNAASRASYQLVSRLIAEGADVQARQDNCGEGLTSDVGEATALHIAGGYLNVQGIKALLDNCGEINPADLVSMRDAVGRISLHWAAYNICFDHYDLPDDEIASQACETLDLLIQTNPKTINTQSKDGTTPLFSSIKGHAGCSGTKHWERIVRFLCEKGADAGIRDITGQNVLHILATVTIMGEPVNPSILDLLVAHGAKVDEADLEGNTPLHHMARTLRQMDLIKRLIHHHGARVNATNTKGETPIHITTALRLARQKTGRIHERSVKAHSEVIEILQEAGCRMDQPDIEAKTPNQLLGD